MNLYMSEVVTFIICFFCIYGIFCLICQSYRWQSRQEQQRRRRRQAQDDHEAQAGSYEMQPLGGNQNLGHDEVDVMLPDDEMQRLANQWDEAVSVETNSQEPTPTEQLDVAFSCETTTTRRANATDGHSSEEDGGSGDQGRDGGEGGAGIGIYPTEALMEYKPGFLPRVAIVDEKKKKKKRV